jgi:hypothetical protein
LLVVCGNYVVIFSDKSVDFQSDVESTIAWKRWYKEAIGKSVRQLNGATRHVFSLRSQIYKDKACTVPLGIPIPTYDRVRIYRVAVVSVSSEVNDTEPPVPFLRVAVVSVSSEVNDTEPPVPFLKINSRIISNQHLMENASPLVVGDVAPEKDFVHVMDVAGLWAVLSDVDTISDFTQYLDARAAFIRGKESNSADSEWAMLTRYLFSFDEDGQSIPLDHADPGAAHLVDAEWQSEQTRSALSDRRSENRKSYLWDTLIEDQAQMIEHQSFEYSTYNSVKDAEQVVRFMALETRLNRRY